MDVIILAAIVAALLIFQSAQEPTYTSGYINMTSAINPNDVWTWPSGDALWTIARAIALAEGYNRAGSVPQRLHNPGDLSDGANTFGFEYHSGSNVTTFPNDETGWEWLHAKLQRIDSNGSQVYSRDMTWEQIAQKWAGNWQAWANNVCSALGVNTDSTFGDYVDGVFT